MKRNAPQNMAASVRQRLQNLARQRQEDFQLVLGRFALERLLYRISQTRHHDRFVLKGAILFHLWTDLPHRPTRDIDLLAHGDHSIGHLEEVFRDVCDQVVEDDGLVFGANSVAGEVIKPDQEYEGIRIRLVGTLEAPAFRFRSISGLAIPLRRVRSQFSIRRCSAFRRRSCRPIPRKRWSPRSCKRW